MTGSVSDAGNGGTYIEHGRGQCMRERMKERGNQNVNTKSLAERVKD